MEELVFFGRKQPALDPQNRLTLPGEWRRSDGENRLVVVPGAGKALLLFPFDTFREFFNKVRSASLSDPAAQKALALLGAYSFECRCDKQGRIKLDRDMLDSIGVKDKVFLAGAVTHIRLTSPENWDLMASGNLEECFDELKKIAGQGSEALVQFLREGFKQ